MGSTDTNTLALPRLLCLHGGGVNAEVFALQTRTITRLLASQFRFIFVDGPFLCDAGPGIAPVYEDFGPFRRWLRWLPEHQEVDGGAAVDEIWWQINEAIERDDALGASGEIVGLFGFSQGAKLAASLLYEQQWRDAHADAIKDNAVDAKKPHFRFAVLLAGRAPLVSLRTETDSVKNLVTAAEVSEGYDNVDESTSEHILRLPTIHVHGLADAGLHLHRRLYEQYCAPEARTLIEWDGAHRVPVKTSDAQKVTDSIVEAATRAGLYV